VRAGEADVFHTRQQHTLKVAQVGRRLAQICIDQQPDECDYWGVDPEVVEAACLAHDLGHPPFGHVGEHTLNELIDEHVEKEEDPNNLDCQKDQGDKKYNEVDGFEGNAQSFRIVTKLSVRFTACNGLDLTRATLSAVLKYPWIRGDKTSDRHKKWGAYRIDQDDFDFTQHADHVGLKCAEAELMDWADDIAYSVHDIEDFHRCGAIPWKKIFDGTRSEVLIKRALTAWHRPPNDAAGRLREAMRNLEKYLMGGFRKTIEEPYEGTREQRQELRNLTSSLIARYIIALKLSARPTANFPTRIAIIDPEKEDEVRILKQITRDYIISTPALVAQQFGQKRIIESLYQMLVESSLTEPAAFLPSRLRYLWSRDVSVARFAADCISSLTETEAVALHARLHGISSGSVLDPIVR
jgi:dGTPase